MNWQRKIDVTINYGEDDQGKSNRQETTAKLLRYVDHYGEYGPMAEYETASGQRFWITSELMEDCQQKKTLPDIPIEVIRKNAEIANKLQYGAEMLKLQQQKSESKLILPDGYEDIPSV